MIPLVMWNTTFGQRSWAPRIFPKEVEKKSFGKNRICIPLESDPVYPDALIRIVKATTA
jgi:hypothetical protein